MKDTTASSEARAPTCTYAIRAREEATTLYFIDGTFYLFDFTVYVLIEPGSTHSYIYIALVTEKKFLVESINYDIQVTNPLGRSVIVNLVYRNCSLKVKGCEFPADLMLLPFWEFDVIPGTDWLPLHDAVRLMQKGNEAFLAYIPDTRSLKSKLDQLPVVNEFTDVFPKELRSLPHDREVEFVIDVIPGIALILVTPYRMAPAELRS
ncbi:uncharacterized protein [Gossypium hirsutum]|uniref:Uncharacterized protein n=1 Tax=Gossypium hirsutum TaxID=3635 RepID=A0A1U8LYI6_GOSHI|nr:uncharacterized protein LOC107932182 [Gossypium hirsutum]